MIDAKNYDSAVKTYFEYVESEFGFELVTEKYRGNVFYDVQYKLNRILLSVSYENIEDYLQVIIFLLEDGRLPDYDDKTRTLHLEKLRESIFPKVGKAEILSNNERFSELKPMDDFHMRLLKSAKELRICLLHFNDR